jgi:hypothetical protein
MDYEQSEIRREIESARAGLVEKISTLETRFGAAIEEIRRLSDVKYQVERRPWLMMGLSAVTGYMVSRLIFARPQRRTVIVHGHRKIAAGSFIGGIVSSMAVALARELAANLMKKRDKPSRRGPEKSLTEEAKRLH